MYTLTDLGKTVFSSRHVGLISKLLWIKEESTFSITVAGTF